MPPAEGLESDPRRRPETCELVRANFAIEDMAVRRRLIDLVTARAAENDATAEKFPARTVRLAGGYGCDARPADYHSARLC
jgi:hypothetical protein